MNNFEAVGQWLAFINTQKGHDELKRTFAKYPWLKDKMPEVSSLVEKLHTDLPKMLQIIKLQEKQNAIMRKYIHVNQIADEAIVRAVAEKAGIQL